MKIYVELELKNHTVADYKAHQAEWHTTGDAQVIAIDRAYLDDLPDDPTDNSFVLLTLAADVGETIDRKQIRPLGWVGPLPSGKGFSGMD